MRSFNLPGRLAVRLLWTAGIAGLVLFAAVAGLGLGDSGSPGFQAFHVCMYVVPGALCLLRAVLVREERLVWALLGTGMAAWGAGYAYHFLVTQHLESPPYPSPSDALWLSSTGLRSSRCCC